VRPGSDGRGHLYSVSAAAGPARLLSGSIDVETAPDYGPFLELSPEGEWIGFRGRDQRLYIARTSAGLEPLLASELGRTEADFHLGPTQVLYLSLGSNGDGINLYGRPYGSLTTARR
jgi:hypothetical protein